MWIYPGTNRRAFLQSMGGGFGSLALAALEAQSLSAADRATAKRDRAGEIAAAVHPMAARAPDHPPRASAVIFLFLVGGPSQLETFDYKPQLQKLDGQAVPAAIRQAVMQTPHANVFHGCADKIMGSQYTWKQHGQSGMWVSDLLPHTAGHVDDLCFIHSMQAESNNHAPASYQLHTGEVQAGKASLGSWLTYGLGSVSSQLPGYVTLFDVGPLGGAANYSNGFLPPAFQPTRLRDRGLPVLNLLPPERFAAGQRDSIDLIQQLNRLHRDQRRPGDDLDARIASYELAYQMQSAALEVGDFADEPQYIHDEYGLNHGEARTQSFARKCLLSRRLVERGVRFVQLYDMPDKDGWDAHDNLASNHTPRAFWTDQPIAALIGDLKRSGLLETTLVICASEFGRTPMMQGNQGRQHNAAGFTIWLAGGGVRAGTRLGSTDEIGLLATERPVSFRELHATILHLLGLDHEALFYEVNGRQERLTGVAGATRPILEIL
jgi:hypothetical protein